MSFTRRYFLEIPEETVEIAQATFPQGNVYMTMRDELGILYKDEDFKGLFAHDGQPGLPPGMLGMVTVMQYAEGLTDRQTAEAVRARIDWKYALNLEIRDSGFNYSVLSEFRERLIVGGQEMKLLDDMLAKCQEKKLIKARGQQRTDSTAVLANIRQLNRISCVGETMRRVLNELSGIAPEWVLAQVNQDWFDRYGPRFDGYRMPKKKGEQKELRNKIGADGWYLLQKIYENEAASYLAEVPAVKVLRLVWLQQYQIVAGKLEWREDKNIPPKRLLIQSPYDIEARNSSKRDVNWSGYKVHLTESCDEENPNIITHVETSVATTADVAVIDEIHDALAKKNLSPAEHFIDAGYTSAPKLLHSQKEHDIELIGPVLPDSSWQTRANQGYGSACFIINWEEKQATCPTGKTSTTWREGCDKHQQARIQIQFATNDCLGCSTRENCTKSKNQPRTLSVYSQPVYEVLQSARKRQETDEFKEKYQKRAGVEGTISQGTRSFGLRRARYVGLAKTHLQNVATATAMNLARIVAWLHDVPKGKTRTSRFMALSPSF